MPRYRYPLPSWTRAALLAALPDAPAPDTDEDDFDTDDYEDEDEDDESDYLPAGPF